MRPEIVVDLAAIRHNARTLAALVAPAALMTVVKADGYGHGIVESGRAARAGGATWLGVASVPEALALRDAGDTGRLLCWLTLPADAEDGSLTRAIEADVDITAYTVERLDQIVAAGSGDEGPRVQLKVDTGLSRGGSTLDDWPGLVARAAEHERAGRARITGVWSHFACSEEPEHPANDLQEQRFHAALRVAEEAGLRPEVRHLANSAAAILRPSSRLDLVRVGLATFGLDPAPDADHDTDLRPAMTVTAPLALAKPIAAGEGVSYGHHWVADEATTVGLVPAGYGDGVPRHGSNVLEVAVDGVRRPVRGRVCMDQVVVDLGGDLPPVGTPVTLFGPGDHGEPTAQDWAEACGTISYEIVTRIGGRFERRYEGVDAVSTTRRVLGVAAGAVGVAAAGTVLRVAQRRRIIARRGVGDSTPFGSLRSQPLTVVADDGVPLHVEVDELDAAVTGGKGMRARRRHAELTVVFVHGYALNQDSWHFQRAAYRGLVRTVFYDQRSHGRSGRSSEEHANIEQLGHDLLRVLDVAVPEGPVVLVGHSMGGMTIVALAEEHPELFGDRIVGVGLVGTTAGGVDPHRMVLPLLPSTVGGQFASRLVAALARGHRTVDRFRKLGHSVALVATDELAFGDAVPARYVEFVDEMLSATPFGVVADFFPTFGTLEKFETVHAMSSVPTAIICGTRDKLTPIEHSRKLHSMIEGSTLLECDGAGHMVMLERHDQVNAELDQLLAAAGDLVDQR